MFRFALILRNMGKLKTTEWLKRYEQSLQEVDNVLQRMIKDYKESSNTIIERMELKEEALLFEPKHVVLEVLKIALNCQDGQGFKVENQPREVEDFYN